jgi:hypothetical protein
MGGGGACCLRQQAARDASRVYDASTTRPASTTRDACCGTRRGPKDLDPPRRGGSDPSKRGPPNASGREGGGTSKPAGRERALDVERRLGEDTWQVMRLLVKGQVTVKVLLEVKVLVKAFVVEEVLLFSLSSPPPPTPLAPGSPYDARPGGSRFRGTPTAPSLSAGGCTCPVCRRAINT